MDYTRISPFFLLCTKGFLRSEESVQESKISGLIWSIFGFLKKAFCSHRLSKSIKTFHFGTLPASWITFWIFCIYLKNLPIHIKSENELIRSNNGCIKPGFSTDNYSSIDQKNHLKWHVFEDNGEYVFCYVFGMSVTYDLFYGTIFLLDSREALSYFRCRLFCVKGIF